MVVVGGVPPFRATAASSTDQRSGHQPGAGETRWAQPVRRPGSRSRHSQPGDGSGGTAGGVRVPLDRPERHADHRRSLRKAPGGRRRVHRGTPPGRVACRGVGGSGRCRSAGHVRADRGRHLRRRAGPHRAGGRVPDHRRARAAMVVRRCSARGRDRVDLVARAPVIPAGRVERRGGDGATTTRAMPGIGSTPCCRWDPNSVPWPGPTEAGGRRSRYPVRGAPCGWATAGSRCRSLRTPFRPLRSRPATRRSRCSTPPTPVLRRSPLRTGSSNIWRPVGSVPRT